MSKATINVTEWADMFRAIGLDDDRMSAWHREFESRHPDAHQGFLQWLNLPQERIREIRTQSTERP